MKRMERKLDGNCARMLWVVLNKSWGQHPTKQQLYRHLPPISKTIQTRRARHTVYCWRCKGELISDVLLWTPSHGWTRFGRPARTYLQQFCTDTGCSMEDLPRPMDNKGECLERVREIRASGTPWWWWVINEITYIADNNLISWYYEITYIASNNSMLLKHNMLLKHS